jgi:hypothetical protein
MSKDDNRTPPFAAPIDAPLLTKDRPMHVLIWEN